MSYPSQSPQNTARAVREPLAVVGIGCRFPGGIDSPAAYWSALLAGVNAIGRVPADRWNQARFHDPNEEKVGTIKNAQGGFIDGVDQFDAEFFGYFPTEAQRLDPQQRLLLEVTHEAMEDAGLRRDQLDGSRTSVYVGSFMYDYLCHPDRQRAARRDQSLCGDGDRHLGTGEPHLLRLQLERPEHLARYGLLQLAGGGSSGVPQPVGRRGRHGDRGRRQCDAAAGIVDHAVQGRVSESGPVLQGIRRLRQWLCPRAKASAWSS